MVSSIEHKRIDLQCLCNCCFWMLLMSCAFASYGFWVLWVLWNISLVKDSSIVSWTVTVFSEDVLTCSTRGNGSSQIYRLAHFGILSIACVFLWSDTVTYLYSNQPPVCCCCRAQTIIDILVKHAFDNRGRFTSLQQAAIEKLWLSVREQQVRRKQGKSTTGKLDVTPFERLQDQYSRQHISIRRAVGHAGGRSAEQWLGWKSSGESTYWP